MIEVLRRVITNEYTIQAIISLGTAIITLLGGYRIYVSKLRQQQRSEFQKEIGKRKAETLLHFKDLIQEVETIEIYDFEDQLKTGTVVTIKDPEVAYYPAVMTDEVTYGAFIDKITDLRKEERYLDLEAAAYIWYLDRYAMEFSTLKNSKYPDVDLFTIGAIIIGDLHKWAKKADMIVTRDINSAKVLMVEHQGEMWEKAKDAVLEELYNSSVLQLLQCKEDALTEEQREIKECIESIFETTESGKKERVVIKLSKKVKNIRLPLKNK